MNLCLLHLLHRRQILYRLIHQGSHSRKGGGLAHSSSTGTPTAIPGEQLLMVDYPLLKFCALAVRSSPPPSEPHTLCINSQYSTVLGNIRNWVWVKPGRTWEKTVFQRPGRSVREGRSCFPEVGGTVRQEGAWWPLVLCHLASCHLSSTDSHRVHLTLCSKPLSFLLLSLTCSPPLPQGLCMWFLQHLSAYPPPIPLQLSQRRLPSLHSHRSDPL